MSFGCRRLCRLDTAPHHGDRGVNADYGVLTDKTPPATGPIIGPINGMRRRTRMLVACRALACGRIDGPFGDFGDPDGFIAAAKRAAVIGYEGKWRSTLANRTRQSSVHAVRSEVTKARRIVSGDG